MWVEIVVLVQVLAFSTLIGFSFLFGSVGGLGASCF
jgi:hypothetical protein